MSYCDSVKNLSKYYNDRIQALDNVSFDIDYGKVFGALVDNSGC